MGMTLRSPWAGQVPSTIPHLLPGEVSLSSAHLCFVPSRTLFHMPFDLCITLAFAYMSITLSHINCSRHAGVLAVHMYA